jgi:hypothetical protein
MSPMSPALRLPPAAARLPWLVPDFQVREGRFLPRTPAPSPKSPKPHGLARGSVRALGRTTMFDDCIIVDVRLGEQLVFVRGQAINLPPSRSELRGIARRRRPSTVVRELTGERLDGWGAARSREELLDRAAEIPAGSGCRVLAAGRRGAFTGRAPNAERARGVRPRPDAVRTRAARAGAGDDAVLRRIRGHDGRLARKHFSSTSVGTRG